MQRGFTLIEILIAIAIISIVSSIAVLQFQTYVIRTQLNTAIQETANFKHPIEICLLQGQLNLGEDSESCHLPIVESNLLIGNLPNGQTPSTGKGSPYVSFPLVSNQQIVGYFGNKATSRLNGKKVVWVRTNSGTWTCRTDVDVSYRPNMCSQDL